MTATIQIIGTEAFEAELLRLEVAHRGTALRAGLRAAGNAVKQRLRQILPKPGYPGDKPGLTALRDTVSVKLKEYQLGRVVVAVVGYEWGAGSHGHLVELGHDLVIGGTSPKPGAGRKSLRAAKDGRRGKGRIAGRVEGRYYLQAASEGTKAEQDQAMLSAIGRAVERGQ